MINRLGKGEQVNKNISKMEQRNLLPSSEGVIRCSILDFEKPEQADELLLSRLAELIVEAYFYAKKQSKE